MKRVLLIISIFLGLTFVVAPANSDVFLTEDFTGEIFYTGSITLNDVNPLNDNLNKWLDFPTSNRWGISNSGGDPDAFAQHLIQSTSQTNILFRGFDASGIASGTTIAVSFDYIMTAFDDSPTFYLLGLQNGLSDLDPFLGTPHLDSNDGVQLITQPITLRSSWTTTPISYSTTLSQQFDVLAVAWVMGGTGGTRGIDNVLVETTAAPVPEPATMLLLGSGLLGLAGYGRKKFFKK